MACSSSKQVEKEEHTTTITREFLDSVKVPVIEGYGSSSNYWEWRKAILPLLEFSSVDIPIVERGDTLGVVNLDLTTGKTKHKIQPKPAPTKGRETITTTDTKEKEKSETENWLEDPLMYVAIIMGLFLAGFIIYKFKKTP
jgi:hypothetical protein